MNTDLTSLKHSNDEKQHVCENRGKSFTSKSNMIAHERIHSGNKPYDCDVCDKRFK